MSSASNAFFSSASASASLSSDYHEKQEQQNALINNRKRHNEKATRKQQRIKEQYKTNKDIIRSINNYFYDHDEPIYKINDIININNDYITRVLKYMCRDSLTLEKYRYKIRSNDPEDLQELKQTLINKNPNIKNKSNYDINEHINCLEIIKKCFDNNTYTIEEIILRLLFLYLDDNAEDYFICDLDTGEDKDYEQFEKDIFLILVDFITPNNTTSELIKLPKKLYIGIFGCRDYGNNKNIKYKYKYSCYDINYFIIFDIIDEIQKNIFNINVYKINYFFKHTDGEIMSEKLLYNFDIDNYDIQRQKINNIYIHTFNEIENYNKFINCNNYFYVDTHNNNIKFLNLDNDPLTMYIKYFLTYENTPHYERLYNLCTEYKFKLECITEFIQSLDEYKIKYSTYSTLKIRKNGLIGCFNTFEVFENTLINNIEHKTFESLYVSWAHFDKHNIIIELIEKILNIYDWLLNDEHNQTYIKQISQYKYQLLDII